MIEFTPVMLIIAVLALVSMLQAFHLIFKCVESITVLDTLLEETKNELEKQQTSTYYICERVYVAIEDDNIELANTILKASMNRLRKDEDYN
jgi:hypothetical protein